MTFTVKCAPVMRQWNCCCCSCDMRSATVLFGWLKMLAAISTVLYYLVWFATGQDHEYYPGRYGQSITEIMNKVCIAALVVGIKSIILYGLLLIGIHKKKSEYMLPFLVLELILILFLSVAVFIIGIYFSVAHPYGLLMLLFGAIVLGIMSFLWVVFYSYYRQLEDEKTPQTHEITNFVYNVPNDQDQLATNQLNAKTYPA